MRVENCDFCERPCYPSKGITFVRNDGKSFRFCRSKCHSNFRAKRQKYKVKWTKAYRKKAGKEMVVDTTLKLGVRRNIPVRYSRELWANTIAAMERISQIRARRERAFYKKRMASKRAQRLAEAHNLVARHEHLLPRLHAGENVVAADQTTEKSTLTRTHKQKATTKTEARRLKARVDGGVEETSDQMDLD